MTPRRLSSSESFSDFSIETVPTRIGCPFSCSSMISSTTAFHFSFSVRKMRSWLSMRTMAWLVGMTMTSSL